jgi:hypothetical protein
VAAVASIDTIVVVAVPAPIDLAIAVAVIPSIALVDAIIVVAVVAAVEIAVAVAVVAAIDAVVVVAIVAAIDLAVAVAVPAPIDPAVAVAVIGAAALTLCGRLAARLGGARLRGVAGAIDALPAIALRTLNLLARGAVALGLRLRSPLTRGARFAAVAAVRVRAVAAVAAIPPLGQLDALGRPCGRRGNGGEHRCSDQQPSEYFPHHAYSKAMSRMLEAPAGKME